MSARSGTRGTAAQLLHVEPPAPAADELVAAFVRTGSPADFERVVARYAPLVFAECRRVTRDAHDAEDAAQLTFLALAIELRGGGTLKRPAAWLQRVAQRQALKLVRARGRRRKREDAVRRADHAPPEPVRLEVAERERYAGQVRDAIDELSERYRLPLVLHYFGGLSLEAIAGELGIKRQAVGTRLFRARKMVAERLAARGITMSDGLLAAVVATLVPAAVVANLLRAGSPVVAHAAPAASFAQGIAAIVGIAAARRPAAAIAAAVAFASAATGFAWVAPPAWRDAARAAFEPWTWPRWLTRARPTVPTLAPPTFAPSVAVDAPLRPVDPSPQAWAAPAVAPAARSIVAAARPLPSTPEPPDSRFARPWFELPITPAAPIAVEARIGDAVTRVRSSPAPRRTMTAVDRVERQATREAKVDALTIGRVGGGHYDVAGGHLRVGGLTLGAGLGSSGTLDLADGTLEVTNPQTPVVIGKRGKGKLYLGTQDAPGRVIASPGADAALIVRATQQAKGLISGWGVVESGGTLVNNGRIVADGFERVRTLDLGRFETISNAIENPRDGTNGWYARRGGRLVLPSMQFDADAPTATWGESADDPAIDLVNSARVMVQGQTRPGEVDLTLRTVALLDPLDVPLPTNVAVIGLYEVKTIDVDADALTVSVRYDHFAADSVLWGELGVRLLAHVDGSWIVAEDASVSLFRRVVTGTFASSLDLLAVTVGSPFLFGSIGGSELAMPRTRERASLTGASITVTPEPGGMSLGVAMGALLARRRRRPLESRRE